MRAACCLLLLTIAGTFDGQSTPSERHLPIFGTYSSLVYGAKDTGDLNGTELTVIPQYISAYVLFQCAEGVPSMPLLVPAKVTSDSVDFVIPDSTDAMCPGKYHGVLTARGLRLAHNGSVELIPRRRSYWAQ